LGKKKKKKLTIVKVNYDCWTNKKKMSIKRIYFFFITAAVTVQLLIVKKRPMLYGKRTTLGIDGNLNDKMVCDYIIYNLYIYIPIYIHKTRNIF